MPTACQLKSEKKLVRALPTSLVTANFSSDFFLLLFLSIAGTNYLLLITLTSMALYRDYSPQSKIVRMRDMKRYSTHKRLSLESPKPKDTGKKEGTTRGQETETPKGTSERGTQKGEVEFLPPLPPPPPGGIGAIDIGSPLPKAKGDPPYPLALFQAPQRCPAYTGET